jgi:hypothetical protein
VRLLVGILALSATAACGPIQSTASLIDADVAIEAARVAGAPQSSTYEFTSAEAHLTKARELSGRAQYEASARLAARARDLAAEARRNALAASNKGEEAR